MFVFLLDTKAIRVLTLPLDVALVNVVVVVVAAAAEKLAPPELLDADVTLGEQDDMQRDALVAPAVTPLLLMLPGALFGLEPERRLSDVEERDRRWIGDSRPAKLGGRERPRRSGVGIPFYSVDKISNQFT